MSTASFLQTFWDRIPNATSKHTFGIPAMHKEAVVPEFPTRISKRKQSRPQRSPHAIALESTPTDSSSAQDMSPGKSQRLSLDQVSASVTAKHILGINPHPLYTEPQSRAFRLTFSDEYSRNPHAYVQALLDIEHSSVHPGSKPHGARNRRNTSSRTRHADKHRVPNRRSRTRFHNLQLEQTISGVHSENDDSNSMVSASDINDLTDSEMHTRGRPSHLGMAARQDKSPGISAAGTPLNESDHESTASRPASRSKLSSPRVPDSGIADSSQGSLPTNSPAASSQSQSQSHSVSPAPAALPGSDNLPAYVRAGQMFVDGDMSVITPLAEKSTVKWAKADPIDVTDKPMVGSLAAAERHCCSILRILPEQYLTIKHTLLREGKNRSPGSFKKRDAQKLCRIDVNKTSKIYEWYVSMGWLPNGSGIYAIPPSLAQLD
ncbi:hypothetical protein FBU59_002628 [Linderina macrospora]|uniref:Uncharacterized protein n=1 Tax=Linderina macrospora TaxID=4868 RepID=A0ACC1JAP4_9FUNG|nr:hypothetical protein FBU59_002628 [Linderina macrospora]